MKKFLLSLVVILGVSLNATNSYAIVNSTIDKYEKSRPKSIGKEPFSIKTLRNNVFERSYNLGADIVIRLYTSVNVKNAKIFRADIFNGRQKPLSASEKDINKYIEILVGHPLSGIAENKKVEKDDGTIEVIDYPDIQIMKVRNKEGKMLQIRVMNKNDCKRLNFC